MIEQSQSSYSAPAQRVWDLPTRLFHWTLVLLVALQFGTAEYGWLSMEWHYRFGYATLALLLFRIVWGFAGSQTSRFANFLSGPRARARYARAELSMHASAQVGHNPLGGWSVIAMLLALLVQTLSGLITSNGVDDDGPFVDRVPGAWVRFATHLHHLGENVLLALIGLHIAAVLLHWVLRHDNLVLPMITGSKRVDVSPLRFVSGWRALLSFLIGVAAVLLLAYFGS